MASSMMAGDRRWGQTRKSGMTVLGKVPKPINLPSQRLENHGLDPNVEIVPKGTLTWGSRPSLTASNAWGSSSLSSPNTDGSNASPSCLSGRPSSGGSVTRPSTSASDRSHQTISSAWGPNSRPSSASGILPTNQTSAAVTRPRSAETRPGSSQFSCFAEPIAESVAWGPARTTEKLVSASKPNSFTLSSGDFPTLGSEKNPKLNVTQGHCSLGRPVSASGRVSVQKETLESSSTVPVCEPTPTGNQTIVPLEKGNVNTWRRDNSPYTGSAVTPSSGNWHRDSQQMQTYPHANVPPQQVDSWPRPPIQSAPDGIWYRCGPPGGMCRPGGPSSSYPVESYVYYPHPPVRPLPNSQAGPRHGAAAGGYGPMTGAPYRPHMHDPYIVPNHPMGSMRPEVYPCQIQYESYCVPHPNHGNGNDQGGPVLGMTPCSNFSNQHPNENLKVDSENLRVVPCYYAPMISEEGGHAPENNGPQYKVLLKQHDGSKDNRSEEKDQVLTDNAAKLEIGDSRPPSKKASKDQPTGGISQAGKGSEIHSTVPTVHKNVLVSAKFETADEHSATTARNGEDPQQHPVKKNSTLIEKIESLNNKARLVDGRSVIPASAGEEKNKQLENINIKMDPMKEANTSTILPEKFYSEKDGNMENKNVEGETSLESTADVRLPLRTSEICTPAIGLFSPSDAGLATQSIQRRVHGKQNRKFNGQDVEEWRKKSPGGDSTIINSTENCSMSRVQDYKPCQDASEKKESLYVKVGDDKYCVSSMDPADYKAQHDKMKDIARQRAKQLQKEEEERIREQKARALAKLEELNRRTLAEDSSQTPHCLAIETQSWEDARTCPDPKTNTIVTEASYFNLASTNSVEQKAEKVNTLEVPAVLQPTNGITLLEELVDLSPQAVSMSVTHNNPSMSLTQDGIKTGGTIDSQFHDNTVSKQKQMPHKRQDNRLEEKHEFQTVGVMVGSIIVRSKTLGESALPSSSTGDGIHGINKDADGSSMQHKKKNSRTTRNKNRLDEASSNSIVQLAEKAYEDVKMGDCRSKPSDSAVEDTLVLSEASNESGVQKSSDVASPPPNKGSSEGSGAPCKSTVQWRLQAPKRVTRNMQATKSVDKFHGTEAVVWAPVRSTSKESSEEVQKDTNRANPDSSWKNVNDMELNLKSKRAEMERYVPKPIAKEISQQEFLQQPSSPCHHQAASGSKVELGSQGTTDSGPDLSATAKVAGPANTKNGENNRPNRHGRAQTSWRRRGPPDSPLPLPSLLEGSSSFDSHNETQKVDSHNETQKVSCLLQMPKHDDLQKQQPKVSDDGWNDDDTYLMQCEPNAVSSMEKDHAKMNRGRRQPFKGNKVGNSCSSRDNWEPGHGKIDKATSQMMSPETDGSYGRKSVRNENQSAGHPRSQWQPKSNTHPTPSHCQETVETGLQRGQSQGNRFGKESPMSVGGNHDQPADSTAVTVSPEVRNARHHEVRRERRVREETSLRQSSAPAQESSTVPEVVPQNGESQNEPVSSGSRRHGQRNSWLVRGHETSTGWHNGLGQDTSKHNLAANADRHKQYQRTGYYDKQNDSFQHNSSAGEEAQTVSKSMGRYRERGHNNPRRSGHFYSHNRTSDAYDNTE